MSNFDLVATLRANVSNFTRGMKEAQVKKKYRKAVRQAAVFVF